MKLFLSQEQNLYSEDSDYLMVRSQKLNQDIHWVLSFCIKWMDSSRARQKLMQVHSRVMIHVPVMTNSQTSMEITSSMIKTAHILDIHFRILLMVLMQA